MVLYVKFIRVTGKCDSQAGYTESTLKRACYDSASVLEYVEGGNNEFMANVRVETSEGENRAQFLAKYQAGRFGSFLWGAKVYDNPDQIIAEYGSFRLTS